MGDKLDRVSESVRSALLHGQTTWSTELLASRDDRFRPVWRAANQIPGWFTEVNAAAHFLILAEIRPRVIVEIGSYLGRSTVFYAKALEALGLDGTVTAIDPHTGDRQHLENLGISQLASFDLFESHLAASGVSERVRPIVTTSHQAAGDWSGPIDFLFIDGWHSYDAVIEDGRDWIPHLDDRGVVVFDDATRYPDVRRAIDDLVAEGTIHVYGDAFGQAFAGRQVKPPAAVTTVLGSYRPLTRHLPGHRSVR
jgi:predicted O-methyltransferase YrrM